MNQEIENYTAKGVAACDYAAFAYEEEIFPGQIVFVQKDGCLIKSMVKSGFHGMWPKHEDILLYPLEDVSQIKSSSGTEDAPLFRAGGAAILRLHFNFDFVLRVIIKLRLITVLWLFIALLRLFAVNLY